jgi:hypothetical protein
MSFISGLKQKISDHAHLKKAKKCAQCGKWKPCDQFPGSGKLCTACVIKLDTFDSDGSENGTT